MSTSPTVHLDLDDRGEAGRVARITIDHEAKLNVLGSPLSEQLWRTIEGMRSDERLRVVVLTGAGDRAFCGGADINELAGIASPEEAVRFITGVHRVCGALRSLPVPVIARIRGHCLGAGLEVAAACDMRVATEDSRFGMPEVAVGLPSVVEAALLPRLVGWGKAREMVYTGRVIDAGEALRSGLVERVVDRQELDASVEEWVTAVLRAGPRAIRLQKELIREWERLPLEQAIDKGIESFAEAYRTSEPVSLLQGFLNRPRG